MIRTLKPRMTSCTFCSWSITPCWYLDQRSMVLYLSFPEERQVEVKAQAMQYLLRGGAVCPRDGPIYPLQPFHYITLYASSHPRAYVDPHTFSKLLYNSSSSNPRCPDFTSPCSASWRLDRSSAPPPPRPPFLWRYGQRTQLDLINLNQLPLELDLGH